MLDKILVFIFSLFIGFFLNVIICRVPVRESRLGPENHDAAGEPQPELRERSFLSSFIVRKDRHRSLRQPGSIRLPLVELLTGFSFLLIYLKFAWSLWTVSGLVFTGLLIAAGFIDWDHGIIPNHITISGFIMALIFSWFTVTPLSALSGAALFAGILLAAAVISRGGMGGGDIKLGLVIGGFCGLPNAGLAFMLAVITAGLFGLLLVVLGRAQLRTSIKFGPFLAWGGYWAYTYGDLLVKWYV